MKGVIIKDMEMPKACTWYDNTDHYKECFMLSEDGCACSWNNQDIESFRGVKIPSWCPLRYFEFPLD